MSKRTLAYGLISLAAISFGSTANAHTIQEAVSHAISTGPDVAISVNNRESIEQEVRQAFGGYLPSVDLAAGYGREKSDNATTRGPLNNLGTLTLWRQEFSLSARQMLFDGFAVKNNVEGQMARARAAAWRANNDAQELALNVISAFLDVNVNKELIRLSKQNLAAHQRIYSQIQQRSEGGIGRKADLDQAEGRLSFARTNLMADQANMRDAETNYLRLVGIPAIELVQPDYPSAGYPETQRSAIALAVNNNPELRAAVSDVAVTKAENRAAKASYYPRVDFEAAYGNNFNLDGSRGRNDEWLGMLRARWNLFNGGADRARVSETAWRTREAKEVRNRTHRQVEESVRLAWSSFITAKEQVPYFRQYVYSTERTRDAYEKQFKIGQRTLLDLLDSENELYLARRSLVASKNQQMLGQFRVLTSTGSILDYLGIPLPKGAQQREPKFLAGPWGKD